MIFKLTGLFRAMMDRFRLHTTQKPEDPCDQHEEFITQLLVLAGVAVLVGLAMCLAGNSHVAHTITSDKITVLHHGTPGAQHQPCVCSSGYKLFKLILFLTGFFVGFFASYVICSLYLSDKIHGDAAQYKDQIYLGISLAVGIIGGILTICLYYLGLFLLGATMGWFAGMALLPLAQSHVHFLITNMWLPYCVCTAFAILGGLVMLCIQRTVIILATAFLGALLFTHGLDYYVEKGRVLNFTVEILQGNSHELPSCWYTWLVFSMLPLLCIIGIIVQHVKTSKGCDHRMASGRVLVVDANQMFEMDGNSEATTPLLTAEYT